MSPSGTDFLRSKKKGGDSIHPYKIEGCEAFKSKETCYLEKQIREHEPYSGKISGKPY